MESLTDVEKRFLKNLLDANEREWEKFCVDFPEHDHLFNKQKELRESVRRKLEESST